MSRRSDSARLYPIAVWFCIALHGACGGRPRTTSHSDCRDAAYPPVPDGSRSVLVCHPRSDGSFEWAVSNSDVHRKVCEEADIIDVACAEGPEDGRALVCVPHQGKEGEFRDWHPVCD